MTQPLGNPEQLPGNVEELIEMMEEPMSEDIAFHCGINVALGVLHLSGNGGSADYMEIVNACGGFQPLYEAAVHTGNDLDIEHLRHAAKLNGVNLTEQETTHDR